VSGSIGRNDPCPCGSGKKYKQCCLNKSAGYGPCQGPGLVEGRCGQPSCGAGECKMCGKRYAHCHSHRETVQMMIRGHVMRVHPEAISTEQFDELLADEAQMAHLYEQRLQAPELWERFFAYVEERRNGKPAGNPELDKIARLLRKEAPKHTYFKGADRHVDGYKVILSCGAGKEMEKISEEAAKLAARFAGPGGAQAEPVDPSVVYWHFSASWRRPGTPSEASVKMLQELLVAVGVPEDKREGAQIGHTTRPDGTHNPQVTHWMWTEKQHDA